MRWDRLGWHSSRAQPKTAPSRSRLVCDRRARGRGACEAAGDGLAAFGAGGNRADGVLAARAEAFRDALVAAKAGEDGPDEEGDGGPEESVEKKTGEPGDEGYKYRCCLTWTALALQKQPARARSRDLVDTRSTGKFVRAVGPQRADRKAYHDHFILVACGVVAQRGFRVSIHAQFLHANSALNSTIPVVLTSRRGPALEWLAWPAARSSLGSPENEVARRENPSTWSDGKGAPPCCEKGEECANTAVTRKAHADPSRSRFGSCALQHLLL